MIMGFKGVNSKSELPPQAEPSAGTEVAVGKITSNSSTKEILVAEDVELVFTIWKSMLTVPPAGAMLGLKILVKMGSGLMTTISEAAAPVSEPAPTSAVMVLVVFVNCPEEAPLGTSRVTVKVQVLLPIAAGSPFGSGGRFPPEKLRVVVPEIEDPVPHGFEGALLRLRPAGKASVKAILVAESVLLRFLTVNSRSTVPPGRAGSSRNDFSRVILSTVAVRIALALPLDSDDTPLVEMSSPVTLLRAPAAVATTSTVTVQVAPAARTSFPPIGVPLASRMMTLVPGVAVRKVARTGLSQSVAALAGPATTMPVGRLSVKSRFSTADALAELSMVRVRVDFPPNGIVLGEKLFVKAGRPVSTVSVALASPWLLVGSDVRSPEVFVPVAVAVTSTLIEHELGPPTPPPLRLMVVPPSGALSVPRQVELVFAGVAIVIPAGRLSVKARFSLV
jgi:hypothetical protein